MNNKKLYVLAKVRKMPDFEEEGEYEVIFLYSDTEKNFKRVAECSPEIQAMAVRYCPDVTHESLHGAPYCFNCNTQKTSQTMSFEEYVKERKNLALDHFVSDVQDDYSTVYIINHMVAYITEFGNPDIRDEVGKVFLKCGRNAKVEMQFSFERENIMDTLEDYLG